VKFLPKKWQVAFFVRDYEKKNHWFFSLETGCLLDSTFFRWVPDPTFLLLKPLEVTFPPFAPWAWVGEENV